MTNKEIVDYIMETPHNTNPTILMQFLNEQDNTSSNNVVVQSDYEQKTATAPDYIKNRPFYRSKNYQSDIMETVEEGVYCLLDFRQHPGNTIKDSLSVDYLSKERGMFAYEIQIETNYRGSGNWIQLNKKISLNTKQDIDSVNYIIPVFLPTTSKINAYIIQDRNLLSEELKQQFSYNGVWLVATGEKVKENIKNIQLVEYLYNSFNVRYLPSEACTVKEMKEHVDETVTNLKAAAVANATGQNVTADEFNALLISLRNSGLLSE